MGYMPTINVDHIWALVPEATRDKYRNTYLAAKTVEEKAAVKAPVFNMEKAGYFKVLGKGRLPNHPIIVKAKYFSAKAERKIKATGGYLRFGLKEGVRPRLSLPRRHGLRRVRAALIRGARSRAHLRQQVQDEEHWQRVVPPSHPMPPLQRHPYQQDVVVCRRRSSADRYARCVR